MKTKQLPDITDESLIEDARSGNDNAFKELVERYESRVAATVIGMLGKCGEAEDVGQETFVRFYRSLKDFRGQSGVGTYITRIAMNLSLNELKRRKRRSMLFFFKTPEELQEIPAEESAREYRGERETVRLAIGKLPPDFRAVVVLRMIDGYSTKETAEILKVPLGTVLSRLARAQKKLKSLLLPFKGELL